MSYSLHTALFAVVAAAACIAPAAAGPVSDATRARLTRGEPTWVIAEFNAVATDQQAQAERLRRGLTHDDATVRALRSRGYRAVKAPVEAALAGPDVATIFDYSQLPLTAWRVSSTAALARLQAHPQVRRVHENIVLRPVSVSDLGFISQPAAAAAGATGSSTTIAVIDGGLGNNYLNFPDFGSCTAVNVPAATCRVAFVSTAYPGASTMSKHGTNVSAIALGVAPGARLAMFDVFSGDSTSALAVINAMNSVVANKSTYNIVVMNLSLADTSSNASPCSGSVFASAVSNATNAGITTVAAAGNSGSKLGLADPACVPGVVSVGAVYDGSYGSRSWIASTAAGGVCTDTTAADMVTCFSQSANYLSMLAPGTFVNAPDASFQQTGTSQAAPHVAGAVAVLRARYPAESLATTLQRLQASGVIDVDPGNGRSVPRLDLYASTQLGTALALSGTGTVTAVSGTNSSYVLIATNNGPLYANNVKIRFVLPTGATFRTGSPTTPGCVSASGMVTCSAASLAAGASVSFTISVRWTVSGPIYTTASVSADQINSASSNQQFVAFGTPPASSGDSDGGDAPLPAWACVLLAGGMLLQLARRSTQVRVKE